MPKRFAYLAPALDDVVEGLRDHEKIYALDQGEYLPIRTLPGEEGRSAIIRWELTSEQRQMIAEGADVLVELFHFGRHLTPSRVMLVNQTELAGEELKEFQQFFQMQTRGPYEVKDA